MSTIVLATFIRSAEEWHHGQLLFRCFNGCFKSSSWQYQLNISTRKLYCVKRTSTEYCLPAATLWSSYRVLLWQKLSTLAFLQFGTQLSYNC